MEIFLLLFSLFLLALSVIPLFSAQLWFVRVFEFLRIQVSIVQAGLVMICLILAVAFADSTLNLIALGVLLTGLITNYIKIKAYFFWSKKTVQKVHGTGKIHTCLSVNLLQSNNQYESLINQINELNVDMLLTLETSEEWQRNLETNLHKFEHCFACPKSNGYGMSIFSKFPFEFSDIEYKSDDNVPIINAIVKIENQKFWVIGIHPRPPMPEESKTTKKRDELINVMAREIQETDLPKIAIGDFNAPSWSPIVKKFILTSGLQDPRMGRGFFNTFSAKLPRLTRFPIDHVFCSEKVNFVDLKTVKLKGSDHLGLIFKFSLV